LEEHLKRGSRPPAGRTLRPRRRASPRALPEIEFVEHVLLLEPCGASLAHAAPRARGGYAVRATAPRVRYKEITGQADDPARPPLPGSNRAAGQASRATRCAGCSAARGGRLLRVGPCDRTVQCFPSERLMICCAKMRTGTTRTGTLSLSATAERCEKSVPGCRSRPGPRHNRNPTPSGGRWGDRADSWYVRIGQGESAVVVTASSRNVPFELSSAPSGRSTRPGSPPATRSCSASC
jgi:hypothetical protein